MRSTSKGVFKTKNLERYILLKTRQEVLENLEKDNLRLHAESYHCDRVCFLAGADAGENIFFRFAWTEYAKEQNRAEYETFTEINSRVPELLPQINLSENFSLSYSVINGVFLSETEMREKNRIADHLQKKGFMGTEGSDLYRFDGNYYLLTLNCTSYQTDPDIVAQKVKEK